MVKVIVNVFYKPVQQLKNLLKYNDDILVPVNGGCSLNGTVDAFDGLRFDDSCLDSISGMNGALNEMTSVWWAWKSLDKLGNPEYVGFNHYRRFFRLADIRAKKDADIYVAKPIPCAYTLEQQYAIYHVQADLKLAYDVLDKRHTRTGEELRLYMKSHSDNFAPMNMFMMKRDLFEEWCSFIFPVLFDLKDRIDVSKRDNYQKRAVCFLCERIFGWWCWKKSGILRTKQLDIVERLDFKNNTLNERGTYDR